MAAEDDIERNIWLQMWCEEGEVVGEGACRRAENCEGDKRFFGDGADEATLVFGGYEGPEGSLELLGCLDALAMDALWFETEMYT